MLLFVFHFQRSVFTTVVVIDLDFYGRAIAANTFDRDVAVFSRTMIIDLDVASGSNQIAFFDLDGFPGFGIFAIPGNGITAREEKCTKRCQNYFHYATRSVAVVTATLVIVVAAVGVSPATVSSSDLRDGQSRNKAQKNCCQKSVHNNFPNVYARQD